MAHSRIGRLAVLVYLLATACLPTTGYVLAAPGEFSECTGMIKETANGRVITFAELADHAGKVDYVLFGERHGVKEQAVASSCVLSAMVQDNRPVTVVMEMLSRDDDDMINLYRQDHPETPAGLGIELKWWTRGWPAFENWLPLVERAFSLRTPLRGGDLPQKTARTGKLTRQENKEVGKRLGSAKEAIRGSWGKAMAAAYCGLVSQEQVEANADHQIRRDLSMADGAQKAYAANRQILMQVGRGHSRKDRSLYRFLSREEASVLSIGAFVEGETIDEEERKLYDYLWVTGKADLTDPCAFVSSPNETEERVSR